jgi:hypothetical protein
MGYLEDKRRKWQVNIKTDIKEIRCKDGAWIELPQDRVLVVGFDISGVESSGCAAIVNLLLKAVMMVLCYVSRPFCFLCTPSYSDDAK